MKKLIMISAAAIFGLAACTGGSLTKADKAVWQQDAWSMCETLAASNQTDLENIRTKYGANAAAAAEPFFKELDAQSFNICRTRIVREVQNERIQTLRAEYKTRIDKAVCEAKK